MTADLDAIAREAWEAARIAHPGDFATSRDARALMVQKALQTRVDIVTLIEGYEREANANGRLDAAVNTVSSWAPIDLGPVLSGDRVAEPPSILLRSDGHGLLYPGKEHLISGEPESGKGWLLMRAAAEVLAAGKRVLYFDFEDSEETAVERLRALGVSDDVIASRYLYVRPAEPATLASAQAEIRSLLDLDLGLAVFDGLTEALSLHGLKLQDNADVAKFYGMVPRLFARAGAAVGTIDHVGRDVEARGRFSIGAQHKLAGVDVAFGVEAVKPFGRGMTGLLTVRVHKDRPGFIRPVSAGDRAADVKLISAEDGAVTVSLSAPIRDVAFRPTKLMEKVSRALESAGELNVRALRGAVPGKHDARDLAIALLVNEGFVEIRRQGQERLHGSARRYREADDIEEQREAIAAEMVHGSGD